MVVAFVGFVGAWQQQIFGADALPAAGAAAAVVATFFTFLPSFLFIFAGGPLVESTHGDLRFTAPLAAISAAVVGVIAALALFFGRHVLLPDGAGGGFDWTAALIAAAGAVALFRFRLGVIPVIAASAAIGLLVQWVR
jgi:chromate transporter